MLLLQCLGCGPKYSHAGESLAKAGSLDDVESVTVRALGHSGWPDADIVFTERKRVTEIYHLILESRPEEGEWTQTTDQGNRIDFRFKNGTHKFFGFGAGATERYMYGDAFLTYLRTKAPTAEEARQILDE